MLYPELFKSLEAVRWNMATDIPWEQFDRTLVSDEQLRTIKMNAVTEWSALPATEMFLRDNRSDSDFSAFMSIWFYEEQKHALVLMEYLRRFAPEYLPTEEELHNVRFEFDPAPAMETLMLHFCGEIRLTHWYKCAAQWHSEPVIRSIYEVLSKDEARHAGIYLKYMRRAIDRLGDGARLAFAKIGVLMANTKTAKALHPTNLHVNKAMYPEDSVQSHLPDPGWLEQWLDTQIHFDAIWEGKVVNGILRNLSALLETPIQSVRDLSRYRKAMSAADRDSSGHLVAG
ncbi:MAG: ferritin family protein [Acidithiobacillus sp.]